MDHSCHPRDLQKPASNYIPLYFPILWETNENPSNAIQQFLGFYLKQFKQNDFM